MKAQAKLVVGLEVDIDKLRLAKNLLKQYANVVDNKGDPLNLFHLKAELSIQHFL